MLKFNLIIIFLAFSCFMAFGQGDTREEVDFLLFLPNSGNQFVNDNQAASQLNNLARYLLGKDLAPGQIHVHGYSADVNNGIDPVALSEERALFIIGHLQRRGVLGHYFAEPIGYGSVDLWGNNLSEENRHPNRRVRILVDGAIITPDIVIAIVTEPESVIEPEAAVAEPQKPKEQVIVKEKSELNFPWWILLPLFLIPLLFLLLKKRDKKPKEKKERPAPQPKPQHEPKPAAPPPAAVIAPLQEPAAQKEPEPESAPEPAVPPTPAPVPAPAAEAASAQTVVDIVDIEEEIRKRAYYEFLFHCDQYWDMDNDWFTVLPKVLHEYKLKGYHTYMENGTWWAKKTITK